MSRPRPLRLALPVRSVAAALALLATGCLKSPPVRHPVTVPAPPVPMPPVLDDAAQFGYLRLHRVLRLADRLGLGSLLGVAGSVGADLRALDPERPLVLVVGDPGVGYEKMQASALVPVPPGSPMAQRLTLLLGPEHAAPFDGAMGLSYNLPRVDEAHGGAQLKALSAAPLVEDAQLYVNLAAVMARYGDVLRKGLAGAGDEVERRQKPGAARFDRGLFDWYADTILRWLGGVRGLGMAVEVRESDIDYDTVTLEKSAGLPALPTTAQSMPELAPFVPAGDLRVEADTHGLATWREGIERLYESIYKEAPAALAEMKEVLRVSLGGRSQVALSLSLGGERLGTGSYVILSDEAEAKFAAIRRGIELQARPDVAAIQARAFGGVTVTVTLQRAARTIEGWPVDRVRVALKMNEGATRATAIQKQLFDKPLEAEVARVGSYIVFVLNGSEAGFDGLVRDLLAGKGGAPSLVARSQNPAGGYLYADIDVPRMLDGFASLVPAEHRGDVPHLDGDIPHLTMFGYAVGPVTWHQTQVPLRLVNALRAASDGHRGRGQKGEGGAFLPAPKD